MKTRFFFLLLAAVLLGSVSVKAQSETPLKGDVNGDGKVDVADIVAIIEIMKNNGGTTGETTYYWYIGTNSSDNYITGANYTDFYEQTEDISSNINQFINREYLYIILPSDKTVHVDTSGGDTINLKTWDETNNQWARSGLIKILNSGYVIYRSVGIIDSDTLSIKIY